jgi:hypothetical protein
MEIRIPHNAQEFNRHLEFAAVLPVLMSQQSWFVIKNLSDVIINVVLEIRPQIFLGEIMAKLFAWGENYNGILGNNTTQDTSSPVQIGDTDNWSKVAAKYSSYAIKEDGTMWSWGSNSSGMLGDGTTTNRSSPVQIGLNSVWTDVKCQGYHAFAKKNDNTLWGWGF